MTNSKEYNRKYYIEHRKEILEIREKRYLELKKNPKNVELFRERNRLYYLNNRERLLEKMNRRYDKLRKKPKK